jgi:phosphate transport system protein
MREQFHGELSSLSDHMVEMTHLVRSAIADATQALLDADLERAESVIAADERVDALQAVIEEKSLELLARQQPVATDLRVVVTGLRMTADLERMGDLARHVAKVARMKHPDTAIPPEMRPVIIEMDRVARRIVTKTSDIIATRDIAVAGELEVDDDAMDRLHRDIFEVLLSPGWSHGVETAIDVTLCGRYYERFADHAVSVARRVTFLVTGERPTVTA